MERGINTEKVKKPLIFSVLNPCSISGLLNLGPVRVVQKGGAAYNHPGKKDISRA